VDAFYQGRDGLMIFWEQISEAWEEVTVELRETIEAPGERVAAVERWRVRGRDDLELDFELIDVCTFRDALIVRIDGFRTGPMPCGRGPVGLGGKRGYSAGHVGEERRNSSPGL